MLYLHLLRLDAFNGGLWDSGWNRGVESSLNDAIPCKALNVST